MLQLLLLVSVFPAELRVACQEPNDLVTLLREQGPYPSLTCYESLEDAVAAAQEGDSVLSLAPGYPETPTEVSPSTSAAISSKNLHAYIEFPAGNLSRVSWQRAVVTSHVFNKVPPLRLLRLNEAVYTQSPSWSGEWEVFLRLAKVAGYHAALYGLPPDTDALMYRKVGSRVLYAATKLSSFGRGFFRPLNLWGNIMEFILNSTDVSYQSFDLDVFEQLSFMKSCANRKVNDDELRESIEVAVTAARHWLLAMTPDSERVAYAHQNEHHNAVRFNNSLWGIGNGSLGIFDGLTGLVDTEGMPKTQVPRKSSASALTAAAIALEATRQDDDSLVALARNYLNYTLAPILEKPETDPTFGLLFENHVWNRAEHSWTLIGIAVARGALPEEDAQGIDKAITAVAFGLLRMTGKNGFGPLTAHRKDIEEKGWQYYYNNTYPTVCDPEKLALSWAAMSWAFHMLNYKPFADRVDVGLSTCMNNAYALWTPGVRGVTAQLAHILLPLTWRMRSLSGSLRQQYTIWTQALAIDCLALQDESGAFKEQLTSEGWAGTTPTPNNQNYGSVLAPVIQRESDPCADRSHTQPLMMFALSEIWNGPDRMYPATFSQLLQFFLCSQQKSSNPFFNGTWPRSFDYKLWTNWGSDGDEEGGAFQTLTIPHALITISLNTALQHHSSFYISTRRGFPKSVLQWARETFQNGSVNEPG